MLHKCFLLSFVSLLLTLAIEVNALTPRNYVPTRYESQAGALWINLHTNPTPLTTQISHKSAKGEEWVSFCAGDFLLERHDGIREVWTPPSYSGYPSTQSQGMKWNSVSYSSNAGINTENWETAPPASTLDIGFTSYSFHGNDYFFPGQTTDLAENFFFIQTPGYLRYFLPGCPNFTPESEDLTGECPTRTYPAGEWKFSIMGFLSGTNINSLKAGRPLPTASHDYEKVYEKNIANYTSLIYSTILDVGAMGKDFTMRIEFNNGTSLDYDQVSNVTNINDAKLKISGPKTEYPITISFVKHYATGTYTRNVNDFVCTKDESNNQGNTFGLCTRDIYSNTIKEGDDGKINNIVGEIAEAGSVGDPVMETKEIKEMLVTIRPASCANRPAKPSDPWLEGNSTDCPWWYTAFNEHDDTWSVDANNDPLAENPLTKDQQMLCESGYCFHIDFHIDLGGETIANRTIFGNPDNAVDHGIEKGVFFIYDPAVDGGPFKVPLARIWYAIIAGIVLIVAIIVYCYTRRRKRQNEENKFAPSNGEKPQVEALTSFSTNQRVEHL